MQQAGERLRVIKLILLGQLFALVLVGMAGYMLNGWITGMSASLGGLIAWLPNIYFALRAFRYRGARAALDYGDVRHSFYKGETAGRVSAFCRICHCSDNELDRAANSCPERATAVFTVKFEEETLRKRYGIFRSG